MYALSYRLWRAHSYPNGSGPARSLAHFLQTASSDWNSSKGFPGPGDTVTLGPVGIPAQALNATTAKSNRKIPFKFILACPPLLVGRGRLWYYRYPTARAIFNIWVVALRILAVVPVMGLPSLGFAICWRRLSCPRWIIGPPQVRPSGIVPIRPPRIGPPPIIRIITPVRVVARTQKGEAQNYCE
jgi:hypothetical protein